MKKDQGKYPVTLPAVRVSSSVGDIVQSLMSKYDLSRSDVIRFLLESGIQYIATYESEMLKKQIQAL